MHKLLVNTADWDGPPGLPDDAMIVNAPRPLNGVTTWQGHFRHGVFYAAAPKVEGGPDPDEYFGWTRDDAWQIEFITDAEIKRRALAKAAEPRYGYADQAALEADGLTVADFADSLQLPWRGAR